MSDPIDPQTFEHLVELAALALDSEEAEYLRQELNKQLAAIHELEAIPLVETTGATTHGVPYTPEISPPIREDAWVPCPNPEEILSQAPETEDSYIVVPDIPHTDLER